MPKNNLKIIIFLSICCVFSWQAVQAACIFSGSTEVCAQDNLPICFSSTNTCYEVSNDVSCDGFDVKSDQVIFHSLNKSIIYSLTQNIILKDCTGMDICLLNAPFFQNEIIEFRYASGSSNMLINLDLEGKSIKGNRSLMFTVYNIGGTNPIYEKTITTDAQDDIDIDLSDFSGDRYNNYDIKVQMYHFLTKKILNHNLVDDITVPQTLILGDINDDNIINLSDYTIMIASWFLGNESTDLNEDTTTNSLDFSYINRNWGESGD